MNIQIKESNLCIIGDIHGEIVSIVNKIVEQKKLTDTAFIIAGDVGIGFNKGDYYQNVYNRVKGRLEKSNCTIYGIRGNHDDPYYFTEEGRLTFDRFQTVPDYSILEWKDKKILTVGGASSVDVEDRLVINQKLAGYGSSKRVWWEGERPEWRDVESELPCKRADIIVSHEAPMGIGPVSIRADNMSLQLYQNILADRNYLTKVMRELKPERWYFGHHHSSYSGVTSETLYKGLDIDEIVEVIYED